MYQQALSQGEALQVQSPDYVAVPQDESQNPLTECRSIYAPVACEEHEQEMMQQEEEQWQQEQGQKQLDTSATGM